tara:strand:+ start:453 stop:917 length:465 start_codon:yes stop_codon:yes gene_type:complete
MVTPFGTIKFHKLFIALNKEKFVMQRTAVNPWDWSLKLGYNQAEVIQGASRQVVCAGQTAVDANGNPQHPGDMRGQIGLALENLEAVLTSAGMDLSNVTRLGIYATDVDEALKNFDVLGQRFGAAQSAPPMTLVGVTRLAIPGLLFEIEATACD